MYTHSGNLAREWESDMGRPFIYLFIYLVCFVGWCVSLIPNIDLAHRRCSVNICEMNE
jgi:hypothetical protein